MDNKLEKLIKIIRIILMIIPILAFIFLVDKYFVPFGKLESVWNFKKLSSPFFSSLSPNAENIEKNIKTKQYYQRIIGSPVNFSVNMPRLFKKATLQIKYQNPQSILTLSASKKGKEKINQTLENQMVENLDWLKLEDKEKGVLLFQSGKLKDTDKDGLPDDWEAKYGLNINNPEDAKEDLDNDGCNNLEEYKYLLDPIKADTDGDGYDDEEEIKKGYNPNGPGNLEEAKIQEEEKKYQFQSIDQFLENIPQLAKENWKIAYYNYDITDYLKVPDYQKSDKLLVWDKLFRGQHKILTYLGQNEELSG